MAPLILLTNDDRSLAADDVSCKSSLSIPENEIEFVRSPTFENLDRRYKNLTIEELCRLEPIELHIQKISLDYAEVGLSTYLTELRRVPLLEGAQEYEIFRWMNYLKHCASERMSKKRRPLRKAARLLERSEEFRNRIVSANLRLVVSIAKKLVDRDNRLEDLISDGNLPLIRAVEIFDFERGTRFSTYATWAIRNALFRSRPRNRTHAYRYASGSEEVLFNIEDERNSVRADEQYHQQISEAVEALLDDLEARDRMILCSRFGVNKENQSYRLREIAAELGISTERVRQLLSRSLDRLREQLECLSLELC
ncbi:MAG TPA: sigma-70 family RNA polymerase sigma factor [Planctomycetaceae bacterium]|nr:sigma-70 family RNA polymerase sigma factor [Planctomycetaceae bacterium]